MLGNSGSEQIRCDRSSLTGRLPAPQAEVGVGLGEVNRGGVVDRRGDTSLG